MNGGKTASDTPGGKCSNLERRLRPSHGAVNANQQITPASEWLLDNFYLIEEQIRTAGATCQRLQQAIAALVEWPSAGLPRVCDIALEIISHGDGRVDPEILSRFVAAYQSVSMLKLGELWAIPIMLRLALIENLRRVAVRIAAGVWIAILPRTGGKNVRRRRERPEKPGAGDRRHGALESADDAPFVSEFTRRLQGHSLALALR